MPLWHCYDPDTGRRGSVTSAPQGVLAALCLHRLRPPLWACLREPHRISYARRRLAVMTSFNTPW